MSSSFVLTLALAIFCAYICAVSASSDRILEENGVCKANAERVYCGRQCARTCGHPTERICTTNPHYCTDDCICKDGFVLNEKINECVKLADCPKKPSASSDGILEENGVCKANAERVYCARQCARTCSRPSERMCTRRPKYCTDDCICKDGLVLNEDTEECVKLEDCPKKPKRH